MNLLLAATLISFLWENDLPVPGGKDRWLTNRVVIEANRWSLGNEMYTPDDLRNPDVPVEDAPWDGYTWVGYLFSLDDNRILETRIGLLGEASGTGELHHYVHTDLGFGTEPMGWHTANPSEPAVDIIYTHNLGSSFDSWLGQVTINQSYGLRVGNVRIGAFIDQEVRKGFWNLKKGVYGLAGITGEARAFTTHLQGRLFQSNNYTVDPIPLVATFRAGVGCFIWGWDLALVYKYTTEEFKEQPDRHIYGSIQITKLW